MPHTFQNILKKTYASIITWHDGYDITMLLQRERDSMYLRKREHYIIVEENMPQLHLVTSYIDN